MDIDLIKKLWKRTNLNNKCWIYRGRDFVFTDPPNNYAFIWIKEKQQDLHIHRLSLCIYLKLDYDDKSWMACHICNNKRCWNPLHLYAGTNYDNQMDVVKSGKHKGINKTYCKNGHEYIPSNTYNHPTSGRQCIRCRSINRSRYYNRHWK